MNSVYSTLLCDMLMMTHNLQIVYLDSTDTWTFSMGKLLAHDYGEMGTF